MHFEGTEVINAGREAVWEFVTDVDRIGYCGPGVESIARDGDTRFTATASVGVGPITARFRIRGEMLTPTHLEHAVVRVSGSAPGSGADGTGSIHLLDGPGGSTIMEWGADVQITGRLASLGSRLVQGAADRMIRDTFRRIKAQLEVPPAS